MLISNVFAVDTSQNVSDIFEETTQTGSYELLSEWRVLAVIILLVTGLLIAIAYAIAIAFELPDLKAWAGVELSQLISNAIIVAFVLVVLSFLDFAVMFFVQNSGVDISQYPSSTSTLYSLNAATAYLDGLIGLGESNFEEFVVSAEKAGRESSKRYGLSCNMFIIPIQCLFFGISFSVGGNAILDVERYTYLVDHNNNILSSLYAQRFFVEKVIYKIGPILLALGILARAFFVTRRAGGLLMAIAIGLMFIFPMTYIFNWMTINVVVMGDKLFGPTPDAPGCPQICKEEIPIAVDSNKNSLTYSTAVKKFGAENATKLKKHLSVQDSGYPSILPNYVSNQIDTYCNGLASNYVSDMGRYKIGKYFEELSKGTVESQAIFLSFAEVAGEYDPNYPTANPSAINPYTVAARLYCPERCRQIPYPMETNLGSLNSSSEGAGSLLACSNPIVRDICSYLPRECFAKRYIDVDPKKVPYLNQEQLTACPDRCKIIPPLSSRCRGDLVIRHVHAKEGECGVTLWSGLSARFRQARSMCDVVYNNNYANSKSSQDMYLQKYLDEGTPKYTTLSGTFDRTVTNGGYVEYDGDGGAFDCTEHVWADCAFQGTYFITYYKYNPNGNTMAMPAGSYTYYRTRMSLFYSQDGKYESDHSYYLKDGSPTDYQTGESVAPYEPMEVQGGYEWGGDINKGDHGYVYSSTYKYPALQWWPMNPNVPIKNCVYLVPNNVDGCDACNFVESQYTYDPISYNDCNKRCGGEALGKFTISPAEFARMTADKMYGRSEVISVSQLIVPAYFLPLLGIAITVMFIKGFSQFLGGDIEIPGLQKVF